VSDKTIAEIARRVAIAAAIQGYERKQEAAKDFVIVLTELCAAVRQERTENEQPAGQ